MFYYLSKFYLLKIALVIRPLILILFCSENNISFKLIELVFKKKASGIVLYCIDT